MPHHASHHGSTATLTTGDETARIALVGAPNAGKTSLFNALTGMRAKTGNYPGVTVARTIGTFTVDAGHSDADLPRPRRRETHHHEAHHHETHHHGAGHTSTIAVEDVAKPHTIGVEDLPGTYSLDPLSPDEQIVLDVLSGEVEGVTRPDALIAVIDATTLQRSLRLLASLLALHRPVCVALTLTDELAARGGTINSDALGRALGVPVIRVVAHQGVGITELQRQAVGWESWSAPPIDPPADPDELTAWVTSILEASGYRAPGQHGLTKRLDSVLLHPVYGTIVFLAVMFGFFQVIFTAAAPLQDGLASLFGWLGGIVNTDIHITWLRGLLGGAIIGGVGNVLVFLPQIVLLFLMISVLEGVGYLSRAAFLMDRVMARAGLDGRAFVALLSSLACAVPGIMATRTLPSAKDRIATMMAAPLMTCSARLPVYILLTGLLVPSGTRVGIVSAQGIVMFGLYLLGSLSALVAAAITKRLVSRSGPVMPFYMEMPPYRLPSPRSVLLALWESARTFLHKAGTIILSTTVILWVLLNVPFAPSAADLSAAHVDPTSPTAVTTYVVDHSLAADIGHVVTPVFQPLGFDWRVDVGVLASLSARESFVATMGQISSANDPEHPREALASMKYDSGSHAGMRVFAPPTVAALIIFFVYALQCMSTIGAMRRETGGWKWPAIAFVSLFATAWIMSLAAHAIVAAVV